jgi:hypothetical protein
MNLFRFALCAVFGLALPEFLLDASRVAEGLMLTSIMLYMTTLPTEDDKR